MSGDQHNSNVELVAQGVANIASPLFGGIPATGAIARTATNIRSGAKTPVAGMVHALTLLTILLVPRRWRGSFPLADAGGGAVRRRLQHGRVAGDRHDLSSSRTDIAVWIDTFALTVLADLTVAVSVGMVAGRAALHPPRCRDDDRGNGDTGVRARTATRTSCRTRTSRRTSRSFASTDPSCLAPPTSWPKRPGISIDCATS